jgi:predicted ATPase/transcriptional regulator with XRE-family HTH domain
VEYEGRAAGSSDFGGLLRRYRLAAGLSQEALAERAQMSTNGIGALERGYRRRPQRETLALLASALSLNDEQRGEFEATAARSVLPGRGALVTVGPWGDGATVNLPLALTSFVGRESELDEIAALVRAHRMVTLTGTGGVGKTQMALHFADALSDTADGAVCFAGLAPITNPSLVVAAVASAVGVQEVQNRPLLETLMAYLKQKSLLLILDNCEHVIAQAAIIADALLGGCEHVRILATSREPLKAAGEHRYRLSSLSVPSPEAARRLHAADAAEYGAMVLFADRACAVDRRFALSDENASIVADICRRLDGIPLAIELAAARVNLLPVKALAQKLEDRFRILTGGERTALPRQQTMRAAIDWSYNLLSAPEQRVFERLSVFAGGCTLAAAAAVCGNEETGEDEVFDLFSSLVDKSVLVVDLEGSEPRYRLLESFRQYAGEKLATRDDRLTVAHRHAFACLEVGKRLDRASQYEQEVFLALAREELDNWRAALQWALRDGGDIVLGQTLIGELSVLWQNFEPVEGGRWLVSALELVDERTPMSVRARLSYTEATIAMALGQSEVQLASSRHAVERYRVAGEPLGIALAQSREAQALLNLGRIAEGILVLQEALPLARTIGNRWLVGYMLRLLGDASVSDGDIAAARGYIMEALQSYEAAGAKLSIAWATAGGGRVEFRAGNVELALRHATDALAMFRRFGSARAVVMTLNSMAMYLISLARYDEAERKAREALGLACEHNLDILAVIALQHLAAIGALRQRESPECRATACGQAARILGFVDTRLAALGSARHSPDSPDNEQEHYQALVVVRDALGADALANLLAEGGAMTEEQAVGRALAI